MRLSRSRNAREAGKKTRKRKSKNDHSSALRVQKVLNRPFFTRGQTVYYLLFSCVYAVRSVVATELVSIQELGFLGWGNAKSVMF
jgi:hypothetical protein